MSGMIQGGWEFVQAAYIITGLGLAGYIVGTLRAWRQAERETHD